MSFLYTPMSSPSTFFLNKRRVVFTKQFVAFEFAISLRSCRGISSWKEAVWWVKIYDVRGQVYLQISSIYKWLHNKKHQQQQHTIIDEVNASGTDEGTEILSKPVDRHLNPPQTTHYCHCQRHRRIYVTTYSTQQYHPTWRSQGVHPRSAEKKIGVIYREKCTTWHSKSEIVKFRRTFLLVEEMGAWVC